MFGKLRKLFRGWKVFLAVTSVLSIIDSISDGYLDYMVPTLEKQFGLDSSRSGILMSASQLGRLPFVLFVSYIGGRYNLPRLLGVVSIIIGAMNIAMASTRFIVASDQIHVANHSDDYDFQQFCNISLPGSSAVRPSMNVGAYVVFYIARAVIGFAGIPSTTIATAYLEDVIPKRLFPFAIALSLAVQSVGVFISSYIASWTDTIYVTLAKTESNLKPGDPSWIGAWWLGFAITGFLYILTGPIMFIFPKDLTGNAAGEEDRRGADRVASANEDADDRSSSLETYKWKDLPRAILRLLKNKIFVIFVVIGCVNSFESDGVGIFEYKYFVEEFRVPERKATLMTGIGEPISNIIGVLLGGFVASKFRLSFRKIVIVCIITTLTFIVYNIPAMLIHCNRQHFAGVNYTDGVVSLTNACNDACNCSLAEYTPVCDQGLNYFSACHAGCSGLTNITGSDADARIYDGCKCTASGSVVDGICPGSCPVWAALFLMLILPNISDGFQDTPGQTNVLRSVERRDKSISLGFMAVIHALISLASPPLAGAVIDTTCMVWGEDSSGSRGNCWIYDYTAFRFKFMGVELGIHITQTVLFVAVYILTRNDLETRKTPGENVIEGSETRPLLT